MKYELINKKTGQTTICDKFTGRGSDFYVNDSYIESFAFNTKSFEHNTIEYKILDYRGVPIDREEMNKLKEDGYRNLIAIGRLNHPHVGKVIDESEEFVKNQSKLKLFDENEHRLFLEGFRLSQKSNPYSITDLVDLVEWLTVLQPNQKCTVHPPAGSGGSTGIHLLTTIELIQKWESQRIKRLYYV